MSIVTQTPAPHTPFILRGQVLSFTGDPFIEGIGAARIDSDGALVIDKGKITACGAAPDILARYPQWPVQHHARDLIMPGFIDCHVHFPQMEIIGAFGEQLLEWLERYTFPAEEKFADESYARACANTFLDQCLMNGTTSASVYASVHALSADAIFAAASARGMCLAAGKVLMDRNAPQALRDSAKSGYDESKALIARWHGRDRLTYAITPRFAITSTPEQLEAAGALWREHPEALMQTHLSENHAEIELTRALYPGEADYLAVYERFGLAGPGAIFGHAIHLSGRERDAMRARGSAIAHCPSSNLFLGSGLFDLPGLREARNDLPVGLASDVGAGTSLSMLKTMKAAYEVARLKAYGLHPAKAFYLATLGSARAMRLDHRIGNTAPGYDADLVLLDLSSTPAIEQRMATTGDIWEGLFVQIIMADERAIRATYVAGRKLYERSA